MGTRRSGVQDSTLHASLATNGSTTGTNGMTGTNIMNVTNRFAVLGEGLWRRCATSLR